MENQIAMCQNYIRYNIEGAGQAKITVFEDEGYSGKNTNRPQFQKMMQEVRKGNCSHLVCYKLDRLGRNIADLANLVETLNQWNISFISIKERFDTSTPIGKAMLYFAGVLAQMEREQIAERVRDNMVMLARKGRWLGGNTPLGFMAESEEQVLINGRNKKSFRLAVDKEEMKTVQVIFEEYLRQQSLMGVVRYFLNRGIKTKRGKEYTTTAIRDILTNPVYCKADKEAYQYFWNLGCQVCIEEEEADGDYGLIAYAKTSSSQYKSKENEPEKWIVAKGKHPGIISGKDFSKIQNLLARNRSKGEAWHKPQNQVALLSGILYCSCGHLMRPKYYSAKQVTEQGERKFSYLCPYKDMTHGERCSVSNIQGNTLDKQVCMEVLRYTEKNSNILPMLQEAMERIDGTKGEKASYTGFLELEIRRRKKEVQNLISTLAQSDCSQEFASQIEQEVLKRNRECTSLEIEKAEQVEWGVGIRGGKQQLSVLVEQLSSFKILFGTLSVPEKREYLRMVLDKVVWDGEKAHIFISVKNGQVG